MHKIANFTSDLDVTATIPNNVFRMINLLFQ